MHRPSCMFLLRICGHLDSLSHTTWLKPNGDQIFVSHSPTPNTTLGGLLSPGTLTRPHAQERERERDPLCP